MNIQNVLKGRLLRKSNIDTEGYHNYIKESYFKDACDITKIYPNLVFIDSHNLETFWINHDDDGTIVFDLHLIDLIHFFSMISGYMFETNFDPLIHVMIDSYILSNNYLVKGYVEPSMFYLNLYFNQLNYYQQFLQKLSYNTSNINYKIQLMRGVQIHYILLHEIGHIQYRKKYIDIGLHDLIMKELEDFNHYVDLVNYYDITPIEQILLRYKDNPPVIYYQNVMKECQERYNCLSKNEQHIFKAVIENYYLGTKMDIIDPYKDVDIVEECYCDLYAIKIIFEKFFFTANCLSIDNYQLIIGSVICAITCIDIINAIKSINSNEPSKKDKTLLRKELFRPILYKLISAYRATGRIKKETKYYMEYFRDFNKHNETFYRFCMEFIIYDRENNIITNNIKLFSDEWYRLKEFINKNLKLPLAH